MTRVAYVSADLGVPVFGRKGCSIHAQEIISALLRQGAQVELFTTSGEGEPPVGLKSVSLHRLPRPPKCDSAEREQAALAGNLRLREELERAGAFDLIYERYSLWSYAAMEFAHANGVPSLLEVNAPLIEEQAEYRVLVDRAGAERAATRVFGATTALLAVSDEVADYLKNFPVTQGKIHIVPNGVDPARFPGNLSPALPSAPGIFTVGFVGTLKAWHGLSILIEAFAQFHARLPSTRLLIVGDGPEREKLEADVAARGLLNAVVFTGSVAPENVPALLVSMDVAVAPYPKLEKFYFSPLKVYEYMAAGVPVVASRIGQLEKLIQPETNGLLVRPGDASALAAALERLLTEPQLRARLGGAGRATVLRDYTWDSNALQILRLAGLEQKNVAA